MVNISKLFNANILESYGLNIVPDQFVVHEQNNCAIMAMKLIKSHYVIMEAYNSFHLSGLKYYQELQELSSNPWGMITFDIIDALSTFNGYLFLMEFVKLVDFKNKNVKFTGERFSYTMADFIEEPNLAIDFEVNFIFGETKDNIFIFPEGDYGDFETYVRENNYRQVNSLFAFMKKSKIKTFLITMKEMVLICGK